MGLHNQRDVNDLHMTDKAILHLREGKQKFSITRHVPSEALTPFIRHYWVVEWDLDGQLPFKQEVIQPPCLNLIFMPGATRIYGIANERTSQVLQGKGCVVGVLFQPGGFYPFWRKSVSELTDTSIPFEDVFGCNSSELESELFGQLTPAERASLVDQFLLGIVPEPDPSLAVVQHVAERIMQDRAITRVDQAMDDLTMNKRSLQRLFSQYVGVGPKWVIQRYRLHEAIEKLADGAELNWPELAMELGYYDQAHFIHAFKAAVGMSPEEYRIRVAQNNENKVDSHVT
ncbi:transcriptional regulator, AraC family [Paenibacillus curdlanolyticus YK9]|uniref:Transcriptional regulator, AraC family n=1 Tax=Paenibacillus curdlanolyticus YK9 TaxID=717606 RepID=E0I839_9BACL|nr:helix-turn-helix domain-containing protein [Paenibacillus curdlanolyticus]EFM11344.1 transcriptional regulator, AraC family [Paenibacillus curdlanolyticus YK9]